MSVSVIFLVVVHPRVLQSLWEVLLRMILDTLGENRGVQVEFYTRFQYTVEVSHIAAFPPVAKNILVA